MLAESRCRTGCGLDCFGVDFHEGTALKSIGGACPVIGGPRCVHAREDCGRALDFLISVGELGLLLMGKPIQRLQSAMALLQSRSSRQQREEVQQLFGSWDVSQKAKGRKRKYDEVKADLVAKVVEEARRLKTMQDAYGPLSLDASATIAGTCSSAIQTALQHGSIER